MTIVIVTPEYNGGYPGVLKNAIDTVGNLFGRKPLAIATVSDGPFGGRSCLSQLRQIMFAVGAVPMPGSFSVNNVRSTFGDNGDVDGRYAERLSTFVEEVVHYAQRLV